MRGENGFIIEIEDPKFDGLTGDVEQFNRQLNRQIELIINRFPEQYIWDYKRFKSQQDGKSFYKNN